jgi:hypothetical protein
VNAPGQRTAARPVFVVSTGRCGSTTLSNVLRLHPSILSVSELFGSLMPGAFPSGLISGERFWALLSQPNPHWTMILRAELPFEEVVYRPGPPARYTRETGVPPILLMTLPHLSDEPEALFDEIGRWVAREGPKPVQEHYLQLFAWLCRRLDRRVWVERSGMSLPRAPLLAELFPDARFVHLYRDGRDTALSMSRHVGFRMLWMSGATSRALQPDPGRDGPQQAAPPPPLFDRDVLLNAPVPPEAMGRFWSDMVVQGSAFLASLDASRVLTLAYESLVEEPAEELRRLARFIEAGEDGDWVTRAASSLHGRPARWTQLAADEQRRLTEACTPGLQKLYGAIPLPAT